MPARPSRPEPGRESAREDPIAIRPSRATEIQRVPTVLDDHRAALAKGVRPQTEMPLPAEGHEGEPKRLERVLRLSAG